MEFQTLKKDNRKHWVIWISVVLILVVVLCFVGTRAKYKNTQSIQVATGTINYVIDKELPEITKVESSKTATSITLTVTATDNVGVTRYYYSKDGGNNYTECPDGSYTFSGLTAGSYNISIYVTDAAGNESEKYTDTISTVTAKDIILADNGGAIAIEAKTAPNFANTSCAANTNCSDKSSCTTSCGETTNGMYAAQDDYGTTYYYRGTVDNNWVYFAGFYWRIIRVNGDGTIRLIYNGTSVGATGRNAQLSSYSAFNESYGNNAYVGYMYGSIGTSLTYADTHTNTNSSVIKQYLDSWYSSNLSSYSSYLDGNTGWCGDRTSNTSESDAPTLGTSGGGGITLTYYGAYYRLITNKTPSYECSQSNDLYTVTGSTKGNKALTYPIGLITADEVAFAGGKNQYGNYGYWLYTDQEYWTMSPCTHDGDTWAFEVYSNGCLERNATDITNGVRPVINLKADTQFTGTGTTTDVYKVVGAS